MAGAGTLPKRRAGGKRAVLRYPAHVSAWLAARGLGFVEWLLLRPRPGLAAPGVPRDWVGPHVETSLELMPGTGQLELRGVHHPHGETHRTLSLRLTAAGHCLGVFELREGGAFCLRVPLPAGLLPPVRVEVDAQPFFVPDEVLANGDPRRLCFVLERLGPVA